MGLVHLRTAVLPLAVIFAVAGHAGCASRERSPAAAGAADAGTMPTSAPGRGFVDAGDAPHAAPRDDRGDASPRTSAHDAAREVAPAAAYQPCPPKGTPCAIMPLGDSITRGALSSDGAGYRSRLFHLALTDMTSITFVGDAVPSGPATVDGVPFPATHEGHGGFTIDNVGARQGISPLVEGAVTRNRPHIITLMVGTNDVFVNADNLPTRLANLVDKIIATDPTVLILLAQIVPTAGNRPAVAAFNVAVADVATTRAAAGKHVVLVDMFNPLLGAPGFPTAVYADDLHPNDAGYAIIAQVWYDKLRPWLP